MYSFIIGDACEDVYWGYVDGLDLRGGDGEEEGKKEMIVGRRVWEVVFNCAARTFYILIEFL